MPKRLRTWWIVTPGHAAALAPAPGSGEMAPAQAAGAPPVSDELVALILRLALENTRYVELGIM
jgi:hypothetical protein